MEENPSPQSANNSRILPIVVALVVILAIGGAAFALTRRNVSTPTTPAAEQTPQQNAQPTSKVESNKIMQAEKSGSTEAVKEFTVTGKNFAFSPNEIKVKEGDKVKINFSSAGGMHNWILDAFGGAKTEAVSSGTVTIVEFIASKKGTYEFYCGVGNHRALGMVGKFIVE